MKIRVTDTIVLEELTFDDCVPLAHYLNDFDIYESTLNIPYPYTEKDAKEWVRFTLRQRSDNKQPKNFGIHYNGEMIGGVGLILPDKDHFHHQGELGYWVGKPFWNRGIMTLCLRAFISWIFEKYTITKLTASVFADNTGSGKVLLNNGFAEEGYFREHVRKDGKMIDCRIFGLLKTDYPYLSEK